MKSKSIEELRSEQQHWRDKAQEIVLRAGDEDRGLDPGERRFYEKFTADAERADAELRARCDPHLKLAELQGRRWPISAADDRRSPALALANLWAVKFSWEADG